MKKQGLLTAAVAVVTMASALSACNMLNSVHYAGKTTGKIYAKGEQTITLLSSEEFTDVKFEQNLTVSDFKLGSDLAGKTITKVTYVDGDSVQLTLSGTLTNPSSDSNIYTTIDVADHALTGNSTAEYLVSVTNSAPHISADSISYRVSDSKMIVSSTYSLSYGSFVVDQCTADTIRTDNGTGTVTVVSCDENSLKVRVEDYQDTDGDEKAYIVIAAECTTFHHEVTVAIGKQYATADMVV